jgi:hypothetical protein
MSGRVSDWLPKRPLAPIRREQGEVMKQFRVHAIWTYQGVAYADDEGLVSFADGLLIFTGRRSEWAVRCNGRKAPRLLGNVLLRINEDHAIRLEPWGGEGLRGWSREMERWSRELTGEEGLLPPRTPGAAGRRRLAGIAALTLAITLPSLVCTGVPLLFGMRERPGVAALMPFCGAVVLAPALWATGRYVWAIRRLKAEAEG